VFDTLDKLTVLDLSSNLLRGLAPGSIEHIDEVYLNHNYLTGEKLKDFANIKKNESNFCDGAGTLQYQLTANSPQRISKTAKTDFYKLLSNQPANMSSAEVKPLLPANCYEYETLNDPNGKIEVEITADGIFIKANADVKLSENIRIKIWIKDNNGADYTSDYSTVTIILTTETVPEPPAATPGGGGSGGVPTPSPSPVPAGIHKPYINGYEDGTVRPNANMTREEAAAVLWRISENPKANYAGTYSDVDAGRWSAEEIAWAFDSGVMNGYDTGAFKPSAFITRAEFATILVRIKNYPQQETDAYTDTAGHWASGYIGAAYANTLMNGYEDKTFRPNNYITRAEVTTAINRLLGRSYDAEGNDLKNPYTDLNGSHWAYKEILEASVEHKYKDN
jgi:hypothetical protein